MKRLNKYSLLLAFATFLLANAYAMDLPNEDPSSISASYKSNQEVRNAEIQGAMDLGSSCVKLCLYKINFKKQIVEDQIFSKDERISLQAGIKGGILSEEAQNNAVKIIKQLLDEAQIDPEKTKIIGFATAWARAANNSQDLMNKIKQEAKISIQIIDQNTEGEIGFNATLAHLRSLVLNKNSYLYQTEDGRELFKKLTKMSAAEVIPEQVVSWDIGGGSMQLVLKNENKTIDVLGSTDASATFADAIISLKKEMDTTEINTYANTPNPLSIQQREAAIHAAMERAEKMMTPKFLQSIRADQSAIMGIGLMHKNNRLYVNKVLGIDSERSYTRDNLEKATQLLVNKDDNALAEALGIKPTDPRNRFTSMLLVLGFMKYFQVEKIYTLPIRETIGAFFTDKLGQSL